MRILIAFLLLASYGFAEHPSGKAVVFIRRDDGVSCSGVVLTRVFVLTAKHCTRGGHNQTYHIRFEDGTNVKGTFVDEGTAYDGAALLRIPDGDWPTADISPTSPVANKDKIWGVGYPGGRPIKNYMVGRVYDGQHIRGARMTGFSQGQIPGYSGGPLFNQHGQIVGIASHVESRHYSETYHITLPSIAVFCSWHGIKPGIKYDADGNPRLPKPVNPEDWSVE